jgi:hypothetical protein
MWKDAEIEPRTVATADSKPDTLTGWLDPIPFLRLHLYEINVKRLWFASLFLSLGEIQVYAKFVSARTR